MSRAAFLIAAALGACGGPALSQTDVTFSIGLAGGVYESIDRPLSEAPVAFFDAMVFREADGRCRFTVDMQAGADAHNVRLIFWTYAEVGGAFQLSDESGVSLQLWPTNGGLMIPTWIGAVDGRPDLDPTTIGAFGEAEIVIGDVMENGRRRVEVRLSGATRSALAGGAISPGARGAALDGGAVTTDFELASSGPLNVISGFSGSDEHGLSAEPCAAPA